MQQAIFAAITAATYKRADATVTVRGRSTAGDLVEATFPVQLFARVSAEVSRMARVQERDAHGHLRKNGQWAEVVPLEIRTVDVGSMQLETPAATLLVIDHALSTEQAFRLSGDTARHLGERLIAISDQNNRANDQSRH